MHVFLEIENTIKLKNSWKLDTAYTWELNILVYVTGIVLVAFNNTNTTFNTLLPYWIKVP